MLFLVIIDWSSKWTTITIQVYDSEHLKRVNLLNYRNNMSLLNKDIFVFSQLHIGKINEKLNRRKALGVKEPYRSTKTFPNFFPETFNKKSLNQALKRKYKW